MLEQQPCRELPKGAPGVEGALEDLGAGVAGAMLSCGRHSGVSPTLERSGQMHGRLKVLGLLKLHVDFDMLREDTHKQLSLLRGREIMGMAEHGVEASQVVLHRGGERKAGEFGQSGVTNRRPELQIAQLLEMVLGGHALILLQGLIPYLCCTSQMIGRELGAI